MATINGRRFCYFIPVEGYIHGHGFRVSVVFEGLPGHQPTGNWPYNGEPGEVNPYFWGHDFMEARSIAEAANKRLGLSDDDIFEILVSSINAQGKELS